MQDLIIYYKNNNNNIYLFECNSLEIAIKSFNLEQFKKHKQCAYALVGGIELKLF